MIFSDVPRTARSPIVGSGEALAFLLDGCHYARPLQALFLGGISLEMVGKRSDPWGIGFLGFALFTKRARKEDQGRAI